MTAVIEAPRVNANDDQVQLINVCVSDGQRVEMGDLLMVVETTKAAVEVLASQAGVVRNLARKVGDFVDVGAPLCEILDDDTAIAVDARAAVAAGAAGTISVTAKARKLATQLGVDLGEILPVNGRIGEAEVRATANGRNIGARTAPAPALSSTGGRGTRRAVIVGGGGHAACLIDALQHSGYQIIGCTDTVHPVGHHVCGGVSVIGREDRLGELLADGVDYAFVGIGGATSSNERRAKFEQLSAMGFILPPVIHPSVVIGLGTSIGRGCHVLAGATIGPRCIIGDNVIVNQGAVVCHDSVVGDHAHLTPGAILAGSVTVGPMSVIGMAATVLLRVRIGANCLIYNGAHVTADVADETIVDASGRRQKRSAEGSVRVDEATPV